MKARAIFLFRCAILAILGMQAATISAQTVITEDFNDNSRGWWTGHNLERGNIAEIKNGSYFVVGGNTGYSSGVTFPELQNQPAFTIEFVVQMLNGDPGQSYGVQLGDFMTGNDIDFGLNDGGVFIRQQIDRNLSFIRGGGEPCPPRLGDPEQTPDCYLNKFSATDPKPNQFTIVKNGSNYRFLLNDKLLKEATIVEPQKPIIGLMVWSGLTVEVKKITIRLGAETVIYPQEYSISITDKLAFTPENIATVRKESTIHIAKVQLENDLGQSIKANFYAPERPEEIAYSMHVGVGESLLLQDNFGLGMSIGEDWGIALEFPDGRSTPVYFVQAIFSKLVARTFEVNASDLMMP